MSDTSIPPTEKLDLSETKRRILRIIDERRGAYWPDFLITHEGAEKISLALNELIREGIVRQREDKQEHDWEYLRVRAI